MSGKKSWKIFWDLQCPYSKKNWEQFPKIKERFEAEYDFSIHGVSLLFHPQAFTAQCAAVLIGAKKGEEARRKFTDASFEQQAMFMNSAVGDARKSEVDAIFAGIAEQAGLLDAEGTDATTDTTILTKSDFLVKLHDWEAAVFPAWKENKEAMALGVNRTPMSVIDGVIVTDSDSEWGPDQWAVALESLKKREAALAASK